MAKQAFRFKPSPIIPFHDIAAVGRCRNIRRKDIVKHKNTDLRIHVVPDDDIEFIWVTDMFTRIKTAAEEGRKIVIVLPNPAPSYRHLARLLNASRVNCRNLHVFAMDEYANERSEVAPETWRFGFGYAMLHYLFLQLDADLRPPRKQVHLFTTKNVNDISKMIVDTGEGGADAIYTGPGWSGHLAFIEPDAPEFNAPLKQWMKMESRIVTLSPFTLAQNSLHGSFGMSGDLCAVPPKAATIGPVDVVNARYRMEIHAIGVHNTATSWQRMISRLCLHGPVTPKLPTSIHQLLKTDCYLTETIAQDIEPRWDKGY